MKKIMTTIIVTCLSFSSILGISAEFKSRSFVPENNNISIRGTGTNPSEKIYACEMSMKKITFDAEGNQIVSESPSEDFFYLS